MRLITFTLRPMSMSLRTGLVLLAPAIALSSCFWGDPADQGPDPLAPVTVSGVTMTGADTSATGETIRPLHVYRTATGMLVHYSNDSREYLGRGSVLALASGYKIVGNGEVVGDDGNQIGYMADGDVIAVDESGAIDWTKKSASGSVATGSVSTGSTIVSTGGTLSDTGALHAPMLDAATGDMGPDSDDSMHTAH